MIKEIWKDIKGYDQYYQVSNLGRVRSKDRMINNPRGLSYFKRGRILKSELDRYGYPQVSLCINQKRKAFKIHRLVANAFIQNPENKPNINHINFITNDNSIFNLEWCTQKENAIHSYKNGRLHPLKKWENIFSYDHPASKEVAQYDLEGKFINKYGSVSEANRITKIHIGNISSVCNGKKKMAGGYKWKYPQKAEIMKNER
jgi:hypothetical protein